MSLLPRRTAPPLARRTGDIMTDREGHPRPQLVRDAWIDLSGAWGFAHDDDDRGLSGRWQEADGAFDRNIVVPFPPESALSGIGDPGHHPVVWYRRELAPPLPAPDRRLLLHFGAVDYRATVWVSGRYLGEHEGGHTPFTYDTPIRSGPETSTRAWWSGRRIGRWTSRSHAGNKTGGCSRTESGITARPGSGSRSGSRPCRRRTSPTCGGPQISPVPVSGSA